MDSPTSLRLHKCLGHHQKDRKRPHLIAKYKMKCFRCGHTLTPETLTIDHYIPLSLGGSNKIKNLRLACNGCNQKRGNAMPEDTPEIIAQKSCIRFPSHWSVPKYHLGQLMQQGEIVAMEYHPPGTKRASVFGEYWTYFLLCGDQEDDIESFREENLQPLTCVELQEEIESKKAFIQTMESNIKALSEQLKEVEQA
ncbi:MAG: HNH endonuclease [Nostoc sp. DedQUE04]|uniref:HNH endonuclease n=1 Tax=Nostoc sp. DedQUE04 TaxID=3075390 RepID=UPI002AD1E43B|nr:HNH endonuclease [Nostoc sp. DedQUE04]MDZ8138226.1 HNH endonuclease [Nostoc sp. DedQUE04]